MDELNEDTERLLNAIETLREWRDELRPPQNLLEEVLEAASETLAFRLFVDAASPDGGGEKTRRVSLVPREPTDEMLKAGAAAVRDFWSEQGDYPRTRAMWRAMLAAAEAVRP